ncbi:MAG: hypothetical protein AB1635_02985 [Acidobacteriota bacterium]
MERIRVAALQYYIRPVARSDEFARAGATVLVVSSRTGGRRGYPRVRSCARARAIQAAVLTPSDVPFARDGVWPGGIPSQESMIIGEHDLPLTEGSRTGAALLSRDSRSSQAVAAELEVMTP